MLITCKCTSLYKELYCDANESPNLITTLASFVFMIARYYHVHGFHVDRCLPSPPSLVAVVNDPLCCYDLDLGGPSLAPLVLVVVCNPPTHDPHVDHYFLFPPF